MPKYQKKPIIVEAVNWTGGTIAPALPQWLPNVTNNVEREEEALFVPEGAVWKQGSNLWIGTPEGPSRADPGDYIIQGIKGEIYPCKPDIFTASYDEVGA